MGWRGIFRIFGRGDCLEVFTFKTCFGGEIGLETRVFDNGNIQANHVNVITEEALWT